MSLMTLAATYFGGPEAGEMVEKMQDKKKANQDKASSWSMGDAAKDFLNTDAGAIGNDKTPANNDVNLFGGKGYGSQLGNQAINAGMSDAWKDTVAPYTPKNIIGTAVKGAKSAFSSKGSGEDEGGDISLD